MNHKAYREFFRALANPARFAIVHLLRRGPHHVTGICEQLSFEQSRVSHNLACLLHCGFVLWEWSGKNKIYRLNPEVASVLRGIEKHLARYAPALDRCAVLEAESRPIVVAVRRSEAPARRLLTVRRRSKHS